MEGLLMPKRIAASFYVTAIELGTSDHERVTLNAVTRNVAKAPHSSANPSGGYESPNADWAKYTPSGSITMSVTKGPATEAFRDALERKVDIAVTFEIPDPE
jgi:hypothetical protein